MGVDHETFITPIPTFPRQGGRQLRVSDPIARGTPPEGERFPPSPKGTLITRFHERYVSSKFVKQHSVDLVLDLVVPHDLNFGQHFAELGEISLT